MKKIIVVIIALILAIPIYTEEIPEKDAVRAIVGEASNQGYKGMLAIAVGIRNRGTLQGVYGLNAKHVDKQPKWVWDQARKAWKESKTNRIHTGTHWENIKAFGKPYWADSLIKVYKYKDHIFYKEVNK
jgi:spore germination cell wall hydrolase CwlJ-like protein